MSPMVESLNTKAFDVIVGFKTPICQCHYTFIVSLGTFSTIIAFLFFSTRDLLYARLSSIYEAWNYKKKGKK